MKINATNITFSGSTKAISRLTQKAEKRLQRRLEDPDSLMYNAVSDTYYKFNSGKLFTGKFGISTDKLEQFFHIKNGKLYATLVRGKDGSKKVGGFGPDRMKLWVKEPTIAERIQISELSNARDDAYDAMKHHFGIKKCIENGTDTFIGSRGY